MQLHNSCNLQQRIKKFHQHIILKQLTGIFILSCLLLSITPRQFLHEFLASHHDEPVKKYGDGVQYSVSGYNCDCSQTVANSPFSEVFSFTASPHQTPVTVFSEETLSPFVAAGANVLFLRGPPQLA